MKKLSIIIPIYNVEKYLEKCLDSCLKQNIPIDEYEVIAVNDGSPDSCDSILNTYKRRYPNIIIITQVNQGLSVARNNGLAAASGAYIWFVDSDDYIESDCLKGIIEKLDTIQPDLMHINHQMVNEDASEKIQVINPSGKYYEEPINGKKELENMAFPIPAQMTIYRRQYLLDNNLYFKPSILHEDMEFKPRAVYFAEKIIWYDPVVYNFLKNRSGSIMSRFKLKNALGLITVMESLHKFEIDHIEDRACIRGVNQIIGLAMNLILNGLYSLPKSDYKIIRYAIDSFDLFFKDMINSNKIKYRLEGYMFLLNKSLALCLYKMKFGFGR